MGVEQLIRLSVESDIPLVAQLRQQITWLIASGELQEGDRLPTIRDFAQALGINLHTIRAAYHRLEADGQIVGLFLGGDDGLGVYQLWGLTLGNFEFTPSQQLTEVDRLTRTGGKISDWTLYYSLDSLRNTHRATATREAELVDLLASYQ